MPKSYRRKVTTTIKAAQWDGSLACAEKIRAAMDAFDPAQKAKIHIVMNRERTEVVELTIEGQWTAKPGDYIVLSRGMLFPCKADLFEQSFELVDGQPQEALADTET
ncbi:MULTISPECIES: hypothetical protein [unclassified Pseudomonas]|uniref:hypothetical protein n=1 Tax=unclassified Pseudomonas TaxID=196821 RepID=UPI001C60F211|nr:MULTISPECIES: hypothetical protein [unclassified Pseudomonas]MBW5416123.1 hypothetical protein [Pseudomonas sp. MAG002Y]